MRRATRVIPLLFCWVLAHSAVATEVNLQDWIFDVDGTLYEDFLGDDFPTTGSLIDGFGTLSLEVTGAGPHSVTAFFDFEIDEPTNSFFNEHGEAVNAPADGQRWEIDEPGFIFGDILDHLVPGIPLDNTNGVPAVPAGFGDDVSFALSWDFALLPGDVASINFILSPDIVDPGTLYLVHTDPDSDFQIFFSSTLAIASTGGAPGPNPPSLVDVPAPLTAPLVLLGMVGLAAAGRRRRKRHVDWMARPSS